MDFFRRISFNFLYLRRPPWDSGITPPELLSFLQNDHPGRGIDLGCGTGTNVITMTRMGWQMTGVDFASYAIARARQKAKKAQIRADFVVGDVTDLQGISGPFDFALDLGCFHSLSAQGKLDYVRELKRILHPGGIWFLYAFTRPITRPSAPGLADSDLSRLLADFSLLSRQDGLDHQTRPSAYFIFQLIVNGE